MSSNGAAANKITLTSSDGTDISVGKYCYHIRVWDLYTNTYFLPDREVAERSVLIKNMLEDLGESGEAIPIPNVSFRPHHVYQNSLSWLFQTQVNAAVLSKVVEWCEHHRNDPPNSHDDDDSRRKATDIDEWDQKFMQVDQEMLFEIILVCDRGFLSISHLLTERQAANYLDIKALLDVGCKTVANMIKGKSPEEIRKTFNIQNDFTPEEEDQIRRENEWAEE